MKDIVDIETNKQINDFLHQLTTPKHYQIDNNCGEFPCDIDKIYNHVVSSKFRKTKITEETEVDIKVKLKKYIAEKLPIRFSVPFGAYKAWRLNLDFQPDWAEVFNIAYHLKYAAHILEVYPYGVEFIYTFSDDIMYFVNDIPKSKAQEYTVVFEKLLRIFNQISTKVQFKLVKINSLYDSAEDYYIDFLNCFLDNLIFWDTKYDDNTKSRHLNSSHHNMFPYGERNVAEYEAAVQEKYYYFSALMTNAVDCLKERRKFNTEQDKIQLVGVKGPSKCINMGACETSTVHFWTGRGVLQLNKNILKPYIYTYSNISKFEEQNKLVEISVDTIFQEISKNYQKILFIMED